MDTSLKNLDPQKEVEILRTIVLHHVNAIEQENKKLREMTTELTNMKRFFSYYLQNSYCNECFEPPAKIKAMYCANCNSFDSYELCESKECEISLTDFLNVNCCNNSKVDTFVFNSK